MVICKAVTFIFLCIYSGLIFCIDSREHVVVPGDTVYSLSRKYQMSIADLVKLNNLDSTYTIHRGQKLKILPNLSSSPIQQKANNEVPVIHLKSKSKYKYKFRYNENRDSKSKQAENINYKPKPKPKSSKETKEVAVINLKDPGQNKAHSITKTEDHVKVDIPSIKDVKWYWPAKGRIIKEFDAKKTKINGLDISAAEGSPILAAAKGKVVYSGSGLRGYGNLIIIQHGKNVLSAYAHLDKTLVKEGDMVILGQKIAQMGSSGTDSVKLHFEIRYKGKPINPRRVLPS